MAKIQFSNGTKFKASKNAVSRNSFEYCLKFYLIFMEKIQKIFFAKIELYLVSRVFLPVLF